MVYTGGVFVSGVEDAEMSLRRGLGLLFMSMSVVYVLGLTFPVLGLRSGAMFLVCSRSYGFTLSSRPRPQEAIRAKSVSR